MYNKHPKILAHKSAFDLGNFAVDDYILGMGDGTIHKYHRLCPHRRYPIVDSHTSVTDMTCFFHGYKWDASGNPLNNRHNLSCGTLPTSKSGLVIENFSGDASWIDDLAKETELKYSHTYNGGYTNASWLWMMDILADMQHIYEDGVHPSLWKRIKAEQVTQTYGDCWNLQTHPTGWWLFVYPFTGIDYEPGRLMIMSIKPEKYEREFGFQWNMQFYYADWVDAAQRAAFEETTLTYEEDIATVEKIRDPWFPVVNPDNALEEPCVYWGKWAKNNITVVS